MSLVRVLIAPERYAGLLGPLDAAATLARGWAVGAPHDVIESLPLSDGGPGFLDTMAAAIGGEVQVVTVDDPWGRPTPTTMLVSGDGSAVFLEAAQVCGEHLQQPTDDPAAATSVGLGQLVATALALRPERIVVGLGGAVVLDAGLGLLAALIPDRPEHARSRAALGGGAAGLVALHPDDLRALGDAVDQVAGTRLVGLGDLQQPLLGLAGVAATHGPDGGADAPAAQRSESARGSAVDRMRRARPEPRDLLSGATVRLDRRPGAGAGAGLGFGLAVLGADLRDGAVEGPDLVGLADAVARADLVVTGSAVLGWESLRSSAGVTVAAAAQAGGIPAVAVCGRVEAGRRETMAAGFSGTYAVAGSLAAWSTFATSPAHALAVRAEAVARTWSPPPRS